MFHQKMFLLIVVLFLSPCFSQAQKFYVSIDDRWSKGSTTERIEKNDFVVIDDSLKADIIVNMVYEKKHAGWSFKTGAAAKGYMEFRDKNDSLIIATREKPGYSTAFRGYNIQWSVAKKILGDDFDTKLKEAVKEIEKH